MVRKNKKEKKAHVMSTTSLSKHQGSISKNVIVKEGAVYRDLEEKNNKNSLVL